MENIVAGANGTTGKKVVHLLMESPDFNPIAMVRKEAQQAYFKDKNIETVLGDLEGDVSPLYGLFDKVILLPWWYKCYRS
jgi:uncharacterized protein YbjT (DUF2867 family)